MDKDHIEQSDSIHGIIIRFLKSEKKPISMKEITAHVLKQKKLNSDTPGNSIRGVLQRSKFIRKNEFAKFELIN